MFAQWLAFSVLFNESKGAGREADFDKVLAEFRHIISAPPTKRVCRQANLSKPFAQLSHDAIGFANVTNHPKVTN
jgi:hypothetical protein